jgi:hypothetical protein
MHFKISKKVFDNLLTSDLTFSRRHLPVAGIPGLPGATQPHDAYATGIWLNSRLTIDEVSVRGLRSPALHEASVSSPPLPTSRH